MEKKPYGFRLSRDKLDYIKQYAETHSLSYNAALEQIIDEHSKREQINVSSVLAELLAESVIEKLNPTLTRIRLAANNADRNSDVMIELLNTLFCFEDYKGLVSTEQFEHIATRKARELVKNRILNYRQARLEAERKKGTITDE